MARPSMPSHPSSSATSSSVGSSREGSPEATTTITTVRYRRRPPQTPSSATGQAAAGRDRSGRSGREDDDGGSGVNVYTSTTEIRHTGGGTAHEVGADGTLSIRPVVGSPGSKRRPGKDRVRIRKIVNFKHRTSAFDRFNPTSTTEQFRGFYTLFWIFLAVGCFRTFQMSYDERGNILGLGFFKLFSEDALVLALTDAVLVGSSFLCVVFAKALQRGWFRYNYTGLIIQHVSQTIWLGIWISWTFLRQWPWVQSGFLVLHSLSMLMKIHSYCAVNGDLSEKARTSARLLAALDRAVERRGGWNVVVLEAEQAKSASPPTSPDGPGHQQNGHAGHHNDEDQLMRRRSSRSSQRTLNATANANPGDRSPRFRPRRLSLRETPTLGTMGGEAEKERRTSPEASRLHLVADHHPDFGASDDAPPGVADLAAEAADALDPLTSTLDGVVTWPANVTFANFWDYLLVPSLVYDIAFPRTQGIRPLYILEKAAATIGIFSLLYIVTQAYVWDRYPQPGDGFLASFTSLIIPFMVNYLLLFLIIFECICNAFAEITRFADREFYSDWWNSTSFEEFSRKWNKPVHNFLLRHVYASTISAYGLSKSQAALVTFFLSAIMHELLMAVVTKKIRMYLFAMQMAQLPMITLSQAAFFKRHPALGNLFFWIGLMSGFPLLGVW